jgi:hypothetical protein
MILIKLAMPDVDITENRPRINIFKLNKVYYFKHFFDDPEIFWELEPYYEKISYRFKMASAGARNKVMKLLDRKIAIYQMPDLI